MLSEATSGLSLRAGCKRSSTDIVGAPPVVRLMTTFEAALILGRKRMNIAGSWVGRPSAGSRACRCTIAAPACAAPIAPSAISSGVTGRCGDIVGVWIAPVTAQVMMTLPCAAAMALLLLDRPDSLDRVGELLRVLVPELPEIRGVEIAHGSLDLGHRVLEIRILHRLPHGVPQLLLDRGRSTRGRRQAGPDEVLGVDADLLQRRHLGQRGEPLVPEVRERPQTLPLDLADHGGGSADGHVDLRAEQRLH